MVVRLLTLVFFVFVLNAQGQISTGFNTENPNNKAAVDIKGSFTTPQGFLMPRYPNDQSLGFGLSGLGSVGLTYYDSTAQVFRYYVGSGVWQSYGGNATGWSLSGNPGTNNTQFIGTVDSRDLRFRTSNITRLVIDSANGNVGIGTINPRRKLHVAGQIALDTIYRHTPNAKSGILVADTTTGIIQYVAPSNLPSNEWRLVGNGSTDSSNCIGTLNSSLFQPFIIKTRNAQRMIINSNGQVGIGASANPFYTLRVDNGNRVGAIQVTSSDTNNAAVSIDLPIGIGLSVSSASKFGSAISVRNNFVSGGTAIDVFGNLRIQANKGRILANGGIDDNSKMEILNNMAGGGTFSSGTTGIFTSSTTNTRFASYGLQAYSADNAPNSSTYGVYATANGIFNNYGIYGYSQGNAGTVNYGVYGQSAGSGTTTNYGVFGTANGPGFNYGIYGSSPGGPFGYAGFFSTGKVYVQDSLGIGALGERLSINGAIALSNLTSAQIPIPASGVGKLYVKAIDNGLYYKKTNGTEYDLLATGLAGVGSTNTIPYWLSTNTLGVSTMLYNGTAYAIGGTLNNLLTFQVISAGNAALYGQSTAAGGTGVWGYSNNVGGSAGVRGEATGTGYGIYGSTSSNTGVGGFFDNTAVGGVALRVGSGKAGIGINPKYRLDVNGNMNIAADSAYYIGGQRVLSVKPGGANNLLVGNFTGKLLTTGTNNTFIGHGAGENTFTGQNSAVYIGYYAGRNNTQSGAGVIIGANAGESNTGRGNVFVGFEAGQNSGSVDYVTYIGWRSGKVSEGASNTFVGYRTGQINTSGENNTFLGDDAGGTNTTGSNNTLLGSGADVTLPGLTNASAIGFNAKVGASNAMVLGGIGASTLNVGIGIVAPQANLHVVSPNNLTHALVSSSNIGTWLSTSNTSTGGTIFSIINTGSNNSEGVGKLLFTRNDGLSSTTGTIMTLVHATAYVGIGTTAPAYPLDVAGGLALAATSMRHFTSTTPSLTSAIVTPSIAVRASGSFWSNGGGFYASSDARIKTKLEVSNNTEDLNTLLKLKVTNYSYKDSVAKGNERVKGFIAQEVEKIYPSAVSKQMAFIPSIYEKAKSFIFNKDKGELTIQLAQKHDLKPGDKIRLISPENDKIEKIVLAVSPFDFSTGEWKEAPKDIFVFGKETNDFRVIDYDRLYTLSISGLQAQQQMIDSLKKITSLQQKDINQLKSDLENQKSIFESTKTYQKQIEQLRNDLEELKKLSVGEAKKD